MEEDMNMLAADCVVICCCCQCLILQIVIFVLFKLPYKLVRKTREYARKKLRQRKEDKKITGGGRDQMGLLAFKLTAGWPWMEAAMVVGHVWKKLRRC